MPPSMLERAESQIKLQKHYEAIANTCHSSGDVFTEQKMLFDSFQIKKIMCNNGAKDCGNFS